MPKSRKVKEKLFEAKDLIEATEIAKKITLSDEVILLSPACSSFDAFPSYEERGNIFKETVLNE